MILAEPNVMTTVKISGTLYNLAKKNMIKFSEAMRRGIALMLAEKGVCEYDNNLNITRRMLELKVKAAEALQELADIKEKKCQETKITQKDEEKNMQLETNS